MRYAAMTHFDQIILCIPIDLWLRVNHNDESTNESCQIS
jgi:hypothetical protein